MTAIVAGSVHIGNGTGGSIANAAVGGANLVSVGSFINALPYELIVHESIKSAEDLRGKAIGISRIGSASDVAARMLLKALGLPVLKEIYAEKGIGLLVVPRYGKKGIAITHCLSFSVLRARGGLHPPKISPRSDRPKHPP